MHSFPEFLTALRLASRARIYSIAIWLAILLAVAAWLAAQFSGRQPATVALDVGISVIRLGLPIVAVFLLQELLSREFDHRLFLTSLTYPRPRYGFLIGRALAILTTLLLLLVALAAILAAVVTAVGVQYAQATPPRLGLPYVLTIAFIALDLTVVLAVGALCGVVASTPSFVLIGTLGFMLVARSFSSIVALLASNDNLVQNTQTYRTSLDLLGYLLPDLASLDVRMIALYGQMRFLPDDWALRVAGALAYAMAVFCLAVWALNRKRFA